MKIKTNGVTRIVFVFSRIVIKIPKFTYSHLHFLNGCYANWSERDFCKVWKNCKEPDLYSLVAPSLFCSWFGLIQVQVRVNILERELSKKEIKKLKQVCTDIKSQNFGYYKGKLVCVDYI